MPPRLAATVKDPWLALVAAIGGGLGWAVGLDVGPALLIAVGMWVAGVVVGLLTRTGDDAPAYDEAPRPAIRPGTEQARLVDTVGAYVRDLETLRASALPPSVVDPAIAALVAAQGAEQTAVRVAAAVDGLDTALARSQHGPGQGVREAVARMAERRQALLGKLQGTVDGVAEVYTKLLETSATVSALDVGDGALTEVESVNASLDSLRASLAELETERRALP